MGKIFMDKKTASFLRSTLSSLKPELTFSSSPPLLLKRTSIKEKIPCKRVLIFFCSSPPFFPLPVIQGQCVTFSSILILLLLPPLPSPRPQIQCQVFLVCQLPLPLLFSLSLLFAAQSPSWVTNALGTEV